MSNKSPNSFYIRIKNYLHFLGLCLHVVVLLLVSSGHLAPELTGSYHGSFVLETLVGLDLGDHLVGEVEVGVDGASRLADLVILSVEALLAL